MVARGLIIKREKLEEVKKLFEKLPYTKVEFAEALNISRATLDKFLAGEDPVDKDTFYLICQGANYQKEIDRRKKSSNPNQNADVKRNSREIKNDFLGLNIDPEKYYKRNKEKISPDLIKEKLEEEIKKLAELEKNKASREEKNKVKREVKRLKRELAKYLPLKSNSILPGQSLSRYYRLMGDNSIGDGGFAAVWEAHEIKERDDIEEVIRVVALKTLYPHHSRNEIQRKYFFQGAQKMRNLHHPNIVGIYDIFEPEEGEEDAHCYFTMQYINGKDLKKINNSELDTDSLVEIIKQVSDAISYAHSKNVTHGDIKPENILIKINESDESKFTAYVTDFSLFLMESETVRGTTGSIGSFIYASPECMGHPYQATEKSDIYSLGMTAIYGLLGTDLPVELFLNRRQFIDENLEGFTPQFKAVLLEAIELDESKRFSSVRDFSESLLIAWEDRNNQLLPPESESTLQINHSSSKYRIGKFPVTNTEFNRFVRDNGYENEGYQWWSSDGKRYWELYKERDREKENLYFWPEDQVRTEDESIDHQKYWRDERYNHPAQPVVGVSWFEAEAYCNWLQAKLRRHDPAVWNNRIVRLPTEAEWEYAARGNTDDLYTWGNDPPTSTLANFNSKDGSPNIVGKYPEGASRFSGCHDMCGNVWEWCKDVSEQDDDLKREYSRVMRGGCFFDNNGLGEIPKDHRFVHVTTRSTRRAGYRHTAIGFRIVVEIL
jgi:formylglycine-generating enzyme required for sulfatase activity/transcriptional regulator with XRE-family HTH domain